jgi:hypothetical protein
MQAVFCSQSFEMDQYSLPQAERRVLQDREREGLGIPLVGLFGSQAAGALAAVIAAQ